MLCEYIHESTKGHTIHPVGGEVGDVSLWNLPLDPSQEYFLSWGIWSAEEGEVGHDRVLVRDVDMEIFSCYDPAHSKLGVSKLDCGGNTLKRVLGIGIRINEARLAVVDKAGQIDTITPVSGEIGYVPLGKDCIQPRKHTLLRVLLAFEDWYHGPWLGHERG